MKLIVVSGDGSGVGKTFLAQKLLRLLPGWSAVKVTLSKGECPRRKSCGSCEQLKEEFKIVDDEEIILEPNKDTSRLKEAGAENVLWLQAKPEGLEEGLRQTFERLKGCRGVIVEGTSVLKYLKPDINFHLSREGKIYYREG
jgi:dethiobiotin synthetase